MKKVITRETKTNIFKYTERFYKRMLGVILLLINVPAFAGSENPFPDIDVGSGDVIKVGGTFMEKTLKYALIGGGGMLILISIAVLVHRLREDNREKDHTNLVTTFILVALGVTFGFVLIAIGWKAFSADIS